MNKKTIAPWIITLLVIIYLAVYLILCLMTDLPLIFKIIGSIALLALIGVMIYVLTERLKEIKSGEEDDLDKY